jgi:sterol desaturase/sphingolipid hydroxylase (fatty acid hydroxylase superfamily)
MNAMALPLLGVVACMLAELFFIHMRDNRPVPWRDVILNLDSGHILMWLFRSVEITVYAWFVTHTGMHWINKWPAFMVWGVAFLAWDFGFYWMHRLHHMFRLLWSVHIVHHEGEHFNLSLGMRNAWISSLTTLPFTSIPLALAGVPLPVFIAVSTLHYTIQLYNHNGIVKRSGWLEYFFITPSHHRVHHGRNQEYLDRNFGGTFLVWDRLFGSFQPELPDVPVKYGVAHPIASTNPFWVNVAPMLHYMKLRVPRPADSPSSRALPDVFIGTGGLLLFGVVTCYVHCTSMLPTWGQPVFFALIFAATLALGGMSDARRWGLPCWLALGIAGFVIMPLVFGLHTPSSLLALGAMVFHGMAIVVFMRQRSIPPVRNITTNVEES